MDRSTAPLRIALGLMCVAACIVLCARGMGMIPDRESAVIKGREDLGRALAIHCSTLVDANELDQLESSLIATVRENPDLLSAGVRQDGKLVVSIGDHAWLWATDRDRNSRAHLASKLHSSQGNFGSLELRYRSEDKKLLGVLDSPALQLTFFIAAASFGAYFLYLRRMLKHLDLAKVVPDSVRQALDTFAEGLLVMDKHERIVLANQSFAKTLGCTPADLQGRRASSLPWLLAEEERGDFVFPWIHAIWEGLSQKGWTLSLQAKDKTPRTFMVSAAAIPSDHGESRGALVSFEDITEIEQQRAELERTLQALSKSRDEVRRQNQELAILATQDPLTGCLNRRSFFSRFEQHWDDSKVGDRPVGCIMLDVDHFKSVNDAHGHSVGDIVLQKVSVVLRTDRDERDLVCRYGGEEFCLVIPNADIDDTEKVAERCRKAVESLVLQELNVTVSLGVSSSDLDAGDMQELLEQADKALYVAKRAGRNRVARYDRMPKSLSSSAPPATPPPATTHDDEHQSISFRAVTALISALAYRDSETAEHSRRVADLCVAVAKGVVPVADVYLLEMAALLHDIGKIGVPDSILLKPGQLTDEEWDVMRRHKRIGVELLRSTFSNESLSEIVRLYHAHFGGRTDARDLPCGEDIPVAARILTIADAYDSMTSHQTYRKGCTQEQAFEELRRCAGQQFDPELVERTIEKIEAGRDLADGNETASKTAALEIGQQIERLSVALDGRDMFGLKTLACRLKATATKAGLSQIAAQAAHVEELSDTESDLAELAAHTQELLDLCRATQQAFLPSTPSRPIATR